MNNIVVFGDSIAYGEWGASGGWVRLLRADIDRMYNLGESRANMHVYNLAIPGETILQLQQRVDHDLRVRVRPTDQRSLVLIASGVNDTHHAPMSQGYQSSSSDVIAAVGAIVRDARSHDCAVGVIGLLPANDAIPDFVNDDIERYTTYLRDAAAQHGVPYCDLWSRIDPAYRSTFVDEIHPDDHGHQMIYDVVRPFVQEMVSDLMGTQ